MTINRGFLQLSELDYISLREAMKTFLSQQDILRDYDFEGSNMSVLLDVLAWNSHLEAHYLNMVGSEMWVDTAQLRDSLFSHAKELNYVPRSRSSSRASVTLTIDVGNSAPSSVTVPKYFVVSTSMVDTTGQEISYQFLTNEALVITADDLGAYTSANVDVFEGQLVREVFTVNTSSKYVLQSANVDIDSIEVYVQTSNTDTANVEFTRALNLFGVTNADTVFFLQGAYDGRYELVFGDGVLGQSLDSGNLVRVFYRDSSGSEPNGSFVFSTDTEVEGFEVSSIDTIIRSYGGSEEESLDSIRFYAPRHFTTQERAVIKTDFENLVRERFPQFEAVAVYGGEEVTPKQYGKVILSIKPFGAEIISDQLKGDVVAYLTGKNIVTEPIIVDAEFMYIKIDSDVVYDEQSTSKTREQVRVLAIEAITDYSANNLDDFGIDLRLSRLASAIDDADDSIVSNDTRVQLIKRWRPQTGSTQSLVFSFGNELKDETRTSDPENHDAIVYTSPFVYRKNGINYDSLIKDDGDGTLFLYAIQDDGTLVVLENNVGSIDYDTGGLTISANIYSYDTRIKIYAVPEKSDVSVRANLFLSLDEADITVTMTAAED